MNTIEKECRDVVFKAMCSDGRLSLDCKIAKLVRYINDTINNGADWSINDMTHDEARIKWSNQVFERGVINLARDMFLSRVSP